MERGRFRGGDHNTIVPPGFRDVTAELGASLEQRSGAIAAFFAEPSAERELAARVALLSVDDVSLSELVARPDGYLVVGRHSEAGVRAESAASLSLRHVLLIPRRRDDAAGVVLDIVALAPTVRVGAWPRPLPAALGERCSALVLGDSLLLVAPIAGAHDAAEVVMAPDVTAGLDRQVKRATRKKSMPPSSGASSFGPFGRTRISTGIPLLGLPESADDGDAEIVLHVHSQDGEVRIPLREPWLVGGIVLGRNDDKCSHAAVARLLTSLEISRCHLYLRRELEQIVFYDTASVSGIRLGEDDEECVRRVALPAPRGAVAGNRAQAVNPERTQLWLSTDVWLTIHAAGERRD